MMMENQRIATHQPRADGLVATVAIVAALGIFANVGCRHVSAPEASGNSSYAFVYTLATNEVSTGGAGSGPPQPAAVPVQAEPIMPLATPVYPKAALAGRAGPARVGVHITVGTDGRVSDVRPSLATLTLPSPYAADFQAAVEAAVAQWRFHPGEVQHLEPAKAPDGTSYLRVARSEKVEWSFDVAFTFNGAGNVLAGFAR